MGILTRYANLDPGVHLMVPFLEKIFTLCRKESDLLGASHPYDSHLDRYEPETTVAQVEPILSALASELAPLASAIAAKDAEAAPSQLPRYSDEIQMAAIRRIAQDMGFDISGSSRGITLKGSCRTFTGMREWLATSPPMRWAMFSLRHCMSGSQKIYPIWQGVLRQAISLQFATGSASISTGTDACSQVSSSYNTPRANPSVMDLSCAILEINLKFRSFAQSLSPAACLH